MMRHADGAQLDRIAGRRHPLRYTLPSLPGSLFTGNNFPDCKIGFTNEEIAAQSGENN